MLKEIRKHSYFYFLLLFVILVGFVLRIYRIDQLLGFYYDQGRDALVIWDLIYHHKFFLIGPTTGIEGIFRGPWYYWLITPFYWLGKGNPIYPSVFLSLTTVTAIGFSYYLGYKIQSRLTGLMAAVIAAFSFYLVYASRWLSNPTPMILLSVVMVWGMLQVAEGRKWGWPVIAFCSGLSLFNFGSSGELFYFPALFVFAVWQRKNWPDRRNLILSILLFAATFSPLVIFDLKHQGILRTNFYQSFVSEKSFTWPTKYLFENRIDFYYNAFTKIIFDYRGNTEKAIFLIITGWFLISLPKYVRNKGKAILILLLASPVFGLFFYQGNYTVLYDYYLTGYFLIFTLLLAITLGDIWKFWLGKIFVIYFIFLFLNANISLLVPRLNDRLKGEESIAFVNQKEAIAWIYGDAKEKNFNVDVYVPPVIPYAYDYLFKWLGTTKYRKLPDESRVNLLYTLYEVDPSHPERLKAWLDRQKGIGVVEAQNSFGGITVQRRDRINAK